MAEPIQDSQGVKELISQLRDEGVKAGQEEAEKLMRDARDQAAGIVNRAKAEAKEMLDKGRAEIESESSSSLAALQLAARETALKLKSQIINSFDHHVRRLVTMEMKDKDFLRQVILTIAGKVARELPKDKAAELLISDAELKPGENPEWKNTKEEESLRHFILAVSGEMLRKGIELKEGEGRDAGLKIRLKGEDLEIDLTDKAISDLFLKNLLPRFRTVVEGIDQPTEK